MKEKNKNRIKHIICVPIYIVILIVLIIYITIAAVYSWFIASYNGTSIIMVFKNIKKW